jgi:hypothetical protein
MRRCPSLKNPPVPVPVGPSLTVCTAPPATGPRHRWWGWVVGARVLGQQLCVALPDGLPPQVLLPFQVVLYVAPGQSQGGGEEGNAANKQRSDIMDVNTHRGLVEGCCILAPASSQSLHALAMTWSSCLHKQ